MAVLGKVSDVMDTDRASDMEVIDYSIDVGQMVEKDVAKVVEEAMALVFVQMAAMAVLLCVAIFSWTLNQLIHQQSIGQAFQLKFEIFSSFLKTF